ncbi:hypothetical protein [Paenibacillus sp. Marseille-Q9583]
MSDLTRVNKALIIGALDEFLINVMDSEDQLTDEQRLAVDSLYAEVIDTSSPRDLREKLTELAQTLYAEVFPN